MILGIVGADEGTSTWNGKTITRETLSFGYLPEERGLYMKNKVIDQLVYFGMLRGMSRSAAAESANTLMTRLGMTEYTNMPAEKLSKGNQQIIQMIAAVIHDPLLIILDEPFSGLDPVNTDLMRHFLRDKIDDGKFIIMSSHQMSTIEDYCSDLVMPFKILNKSAATSDIVIAILALAVAIVLIAWFSIRIYSASVLHYGKKLKLREIGR